MRFCTFKEAESKCTRVALVALLLAAVAIASCGGGSGGGNQPGSASTGTDQEPVTTSVNLPTDLPAEVRSSVVSLVSPAGTASLGAPLALPPNKTDGGALTMAVDQAGRLRLAGFASGASTTLDASSTAIVLVSLAVGPRTDRPTISARISWILSAASFPQLVEATNTAVRSNISPANDRKVAAALEKVLTDLQSDSDVAKPALLGIGERQRIQAASKPSLFPLRLLSHSSLPTRLYVGVSGGDAKEVKIDNTLPTAWSLAVLDQNRLPTETHILPPGDPEKLAIGAGGSMNVGAPSGYGFYIQLSQTQQSKSASVGSILSNLSATVLLGVSNGWTELTGGCFVPKLTSFVLKKFSKAGFENASLRELLDDLFKPSELTEIVNTFVECGVATKDAAAQAAVGTLLKGAAEALSGLAFAFDALQVGTLLWQVAVVEQYWRFDPMSLRVCLNTSGEIDGCVRRLQTIGAEFGWVMLEGVRIDVMGSLRAFDKDDNEVGLPAGLQIAAQGTLGVVDASTTFRAMSLGRGTVQAIDPFSGTTSNPIIVDVVEPTIQLLSGKLEVGGQPLVLSIQDELGRSVRMPAKSSWELEENQEVLFQNPLYELLVPGTYPDRLVLDIKRAGTTYVQFTNRETGKAVQKLIIVANSPSHWKGEHEITSCTPKQVDQFGGYAFEDPCFALGAAYGKRGYFYFDEVGSSVVLGYEYQSPFENLREIVSLALRPNMNSFSIATPLAYNAFALSNEVQNGGFVSKLISRTGVRLVTYVVDPSTRTADSIQGTFTVTTLSGYFTSANRRFEDFAQKPTMAAGTWRAVRVAGAMPRPDMKGQKYCFADNSAGIVITEPGVPESTPGWNYLVAGGCIFR